LFLAGTFHYEEAPARLMYYENVGTATNPNFVEDYSGNPVAFATNYYTLPFGFADIDNDGDLDFYYREHPCCYDNFTFTYLNIGTKEAPEYQLYNKTFNEVLYSHRAYYD